MSLQARVTELTRRIAEDHGPGTFLFAAVICNGCGRRVSAANAETLALRIDGWRLGDFGSDDYCPGCR